MKIVFITLLACLLLFSCGEESDDTNSSDQNKTAFVSLPDLQNNTEIPKKSYPHGFPEKMPDTVEKAIDILKSVLTEEQKEELAKTKKKDLINYHFTLGMWIRNNFGLWQKNSPLRDDLEVDHPDDASMEMIERLWKELG